MFRVLNCLGGEHDLRLVVLAGCVCFLASVVAINLFRRASAANGRARFAWLVLAGAATGCGIWATHFIAMLAYGPGVDVAYDVVLTGLSLGLAMLITGGGLGMASMHYTGMFALELPGRVAWSADLVLTSIVLGATLSAAALLVAVWHK